MPVTNIVVYSQATGQLILTAPTGVLHDAGPTDIGIPVAVAAIFNGGPNPNNGPFKITYSDSNGTAHTISLPHYQLVGGAAHHFN